MKVLTFGETMLRLKAVGKERLLQTAMLEATFGGSESNAAVSLANFGVDVAHLTVLPQNPIADACVRDLRGKGVDTSRILHGKGRMGTYYIEDGVNQLPGRVIYDRADSAMALAGPGTVDWNRAFEGITWFHFSGITPAISLSAFELTKEAVREAKKRGITVSCDLNYRRNLWQYGVSAVEAMSELVKYVDVAMSTEEEVELSLGVTPRIPADATYEQKYRTVSEQVLSAYPDLKMICIITREMFTAEHIKWSACLYDGKTFYASKTYEIGDIIDNVGGGDAFSGALIYALNHYEDVREALEFATAASCLKYSVYGDCNRVDTATVEKVMGDSSGALQR